MQPEFSAIAMLGLVARFKAIAHRATHYDAEQWLDANASEPVRRTVKAAVGAGTTTDSPFSQYLSIGSWSDSLHTR